MNSLTMVTWKAAGRVLSAVPDPVNCLLLLFILSVMRSWYCRWHDSLGNKRTKFKLIFSKLP